MRDNLQARISTVCSSKAAKRKPLIDNAAEPGLLGTSLVDRFIVLRRDVIRAAMDRCSCYFSDRFYVCRILDDDEHVDPAGRKTFRCGITFRIYKGAKLGDELRLVPHYSVFLDDINEVVRYYKNSTTRSCPGVSSFDGKSELHQVTAELIETKLLQFSHWVFNDRLPR